MGGGGERGEGREREREEGETEYIFVRLVFQRAILESVSNITL